MIADLSVEHYATPERGDRRRSSALDAVANPLRMDLSV